MTTQLAASSTEPSPLRSLPMNQGDWGMPRRSLRYLRWRSGCCVFVGEGGGAKSELRAYARVHVAQRVRMQRRVQGLTEQAERQFKRMYETAARFAMV